MARVRDENKQWTTEASEYTNEIEKYVASMLDFGEKMGFNNEDIFYLIVSAVHEQQLLRLLQ